MNTTIKTIVITIVFFITQLGLAGCKEEVNATSKIEGDPAAVAGMFNGPECAQFNRDGTRKVPGGCTREQWAKWHETH